MNTHWTEPFIGIPFLMGGRTREGMDCWGLLRFVYGHQFNVILEEIDTLVLQATVIAVNVAKDPLWKLVDSPKDGDAVAMGKGTEIHHVGIYVEQRCILHSDEPCSIIRPIKELKRFGWKTLQYYRHANSR